jgi:hypothetical protein
MTAQAWAVLRPDADLSAAVDGGTVEIICEQRDLRGPQLTAVAWEDYAA